MKAKKTLRPLLIVLLFGILSASGWMIFGAGSDHRISPALTAARPLRGAQPLRGARPVPGARPSPGAAVYGSSAGGSALPARPFSGLYAQSTVSSASHAGPAPHGASGAAASAADPPADPRTAPLILIAATAAYGPGPGLGESGIPGAVPAADASPPRGGGRSDSGAGPASGHSDSGTGDAGKSGDSSGSGTSSLLDPPGATGGGSSAGGSGGGGGGGGSGGSGDLASGNGNHQMTVPEPSALALFLAGTVSLGFALRRRRRLPSSITPP